MKKSKKRAITEYYLPEEEIIHARRLSEMRLKGQTPDEDKKRLGSFLNDWRRLSMGGDKGRLIRDIGNYAVGEELDVNDLLAGVHNRVVGIEYTFDGRLTNEQIIKVLPVMNKYIFEDWQTLASVKQWLGCKSTQPIAVKNATLLCLLMQELRNNEYICYNWQDVAGVNKTFVSNRGKILTAQGLANRCSKVAPLEISNLKFKTENNQVSKKSLNQYQRYQEIIDAVSALKV